MSEVFGGKEDKKQMIKDLIRELHAGAKADEVKEKFKEILKEVDPADIAQIEEELVKERMPSGELQRLCDVHLAVFKESRRLGTVPSEYSKDFQHDFLTKCLRIG